MGRARILMLASAASLLVAAPAAAQSIEQRFERLFGPSTNSGREAPSRRPREAPAAEAPSEDDEPAEATPPPADDVPVPTTRPQDAPDADPAVEQPAAEEPEADAVEEPAAPQETEEPALDEAEPEESVPEGPTDEGAGSRPEEEEAPAEPEAVDAEEGEEPASGDEPDEAAPEPEPVAPAYVSPEEARTRPEPAAPAVPPSDVTPEESVEAAGAIEDARECEAALEARGVDFSVEQTISDGDCGVLRPVSIERLSSGLAVEPATQMLCRTALAFDIWVSEGVVPAAAKELNGAAPEAIRHASTYVCRSRSSEANISEHSRGSAIDVAAILFEARDPVVVEEQAAGSAEDRFLAAIRRAACGPFKTVIGPGTDADHADHFHLDIAARSNGSTYCR